LRGFESISKKRAYSDSARNNQNTKHIFIKEPS